LIGIIAARLKDYFNKPSIVITASNELLKGSARSIYDYNIGSLALNQDFYEDLKKLEPFGTGNPVPTFMLRDLRIIKHKVLNNKHISVILKSKTGLLIKSISFNSINTKIGEHLINYKDTLNIIGQINENLWNNKKTLQLTIRDLIL